ncbi:hypothetical protein BDR06DRAFT_979327 [Suillus hirtellus]|nr:hypothetical protein BDR06DRAFT_979327 [Suillus hirtellus]
MVPIILGSNKTPMHPVFITISNINSEVPWHCIAYMLIVKFHVHPDYQSILQAQLWHKCMDLICANLKAIAAEGCFMPDPFRFICYVFTPLVAHVCNLPEATMITAVAKNTSPLTMVMQEHFVIMHVKQMMGREYRDIQCTIIASITGAVSPRFIHAIHSLVDFTYLAQHPVHSPQSLQAMMQALSDFHTFKDAIVTAEVRKGKKGMKEDFFIPKLELMQSFKGTIRRLGTLMQFSADVTERLLITHCMDLFPWMARQSKDFMEQCIHILNHQESMEIFDLYVLLTSWGASLVNTMHTEDEDVTIANPALSWVSHILPDEVKSVHGPRPVCNHFLKGILSGDMLTAFQLNVTPDYKSLSPAEICTKYTLPDFDHTLTDFIRHSSLASNEHTCWDPKYGCFQVWNKFQLQLHLAFQPWVIMPSRVVQAYLLSNDFPLGNCNTILINGLGMDGNINMELPLYLSNPLLYVQYFHFISRPEDHPELMMWSVEHMYTHDANGNHHRHGAVVRLMDANHAAKLIPEYGEAVDKSMTSATCLESYEHFFLNNFADKESYHAFSTEFV